MKHYIFLQNVFGIRVDLNLLKSDGCLFYLIASASVLGRLSDQQKSHFSSISQLIFTDENLEREVASLIEKFDIATDELLIVTNDEFSLAEAAKLREIFSIEGPRLAQIELFLDKLKMKERVTMSGLRIPKYLSFNPVEYVQDPESYIDKIIEILGTTQICAKPIDSSASQQVFKLGTRDDLVRWCQSYSEVTNFELDEFIEGELYHVDSLVSNGEILDVQVCMNTNPCADFMEGGTFGSRVLTPEAEIYQSLVQFNQSVLTALTPIPDGATHHEVFCTAKGELIFLEIAARVSGGLVPEMYEKYAGFNVEESHYRLQMQLPLLRLPISVNERTTVAGWMWYPNVLGEVVALNTELLVQSPYALQHIVKPGNRLLAPKSLADRAATLFIYSNDPQQLERDFDLAKRFKPIAVNPIVNSMFNSSSFFHHAPMEHQPPCPQALFDNS